ncbi:dephospho-CoA kinase [Clostridiales Family XIII bacterium PM5-7]
MKIIGLTGGIGSGKSTVTDYLNQKGYRVIDADALARKITEKGTKTLKEIVDYFGENILLPDGNLNRKQVASIIFSHPEKKSQYQKMTTDVVVNMIREEVSLLQKEGKEPLAFIDAPLLFEAGVDKLTDAIWLVTAPEEMRISRVKARDNVTDLEVKQRIQHQMKTVEQEERAHEIIDNAKGKEDLYHLIDGLLKKYA